ncbi:MAG: 3-oxoacyl-ACP reductase FabG [Xanthomonadales bacterium]|nr:3-oxoacyl-ACP reductase FabG [Xanthomonadales bacterium]
MDHPFSLQGEIALVTGASRGIGRAVAEQLAALGARVIGTATSAEGAAAIARALASRGGEGRVLDVTDRAAVERLFAELGDAGSAPSIVVNNAGITRDQLLLRMREEDWERVLDTDLGAIFRICRAAIRPMMRARRGRIVNVASVVGFTGNPGQCNYAAAKAGVVGFSKALAREVGSRGITVNVVAPGFIETDMTRDLPESARQAMLAGIALGRAGEPREVAHAVAFLVSPAAAYITGATLHVNGGMYMA